MKDSASKITLESRDGLMVRTQVRQSEGPGFKSRSGQIAYFHGVKTRLSTLGTGDVIDNLKFHAFNAWNFKCAEL